MFLTLIRQLGSLLCATLIFATSPARGDEQTASDSGATWRWSGVPRVVVIPDVHGAYDALEELLVATGIVDDALQWSGGDTHLISLGDLVDRGGQSRAAMDLLMRLQHEAAAAGGRVHVLLGNHEHMNLIGDLRYVSAAEYSAFADEDSANARDKARADFALTHPDLAPDELTAAFDERYPVGFFGHRAAFRPDGRYGRWLLNLPTLIVINDTAFVHGGLPRDTSHLSPAQLNDVFSSDLARYLGVWQKLVAAGAVPDDEAATAEALINDGILADPSRCVEERVLACEAIQANGDIAAWLDEFTRLSKALVHSYSSPFWYRGSVYCRDIVERPVLDTYLDRLGVDRVVVGHTPTADGRVRAIRDGKVIMADTGMLVSYYKGRPAALVLEGGDLLVQYLEPAEQLPPELSAQPVAYDLDLEGLIRALLDGTVTEIKRDTLEAPWAITLEHKGKPIKARFYPDDSGGTHKLELAAAAIDGLLGFELLPPTVARSIEGVPGALQLIYPDTISEQARREAGLGFSGWCSMPTQFQLMYIFDLLIANPARSAADVLYRRESWTLHLINHGTAFSKDRKLPRGLSDDAIKFPEGVGAVLGALDENALRGRLDGLLDKSRIRAILSRRDQLLKTFVTP